MQGRDIEKELKNGLPEPVYMVVSEERGFLENIHSKFIEVILGGHNRDFNYDVFDSSSSAGEIIDAASTLPVLAPRRLVILKDFHEFERSVIDDLKSYFDDPCPSTCMLILSREYDNSFKDITEKVYVHQIKDDELYSWIREVCAKNDVEISREAVNYLIENIGNDPDMIISEIERLIMSGIDKIDIDDVFASTSITREYSSFDLLDAIRERKIDKVLKIIRSMFSASADSLRIATMIIGSLNWEFRNLYRIYINRGRRPEGMKDSIYRKMRSYLKNYNENDYYEIFSALHEADIRLRTSIRPDVVMESLMLRLLGRKVY